MLLDFPCKLGKREFSVDSGASLHMMSKSELTPEERETIRKSKDPSDIVTTNGAAYK